MIAVARRAHQTSQELVSKSSHERTHALGRMADIIRFRQDDILEANTLDLEASREMAVPELILEWLKLTPERLQTVVQMLHRLQETPDPLRQISATPYQVEHCQTYGQLMPLGVVALVYESFPELGAIAAGLCIRTGNVLILKGGTEASHSNQILTDVLQEALTDAGLPDSCVQLLPSDQGDLTRELLALDQHINLVVPYGRASLVQQVLKQSIVPVLKTAIGNCYLYWAPSGRLDQVYNIIYDSHQSEPDPVNAVEKVLVPPTCEATLLKELFHGLAEKGFSLRGDAQMVERFPDLTLADDSEWNHAYLQKIVAFKTVSSLNRAIAWMNQHSSGHANCLVTESYVESRTFATGVNSAMVYINASPRFYRDPRQGSPIALGMSNHRGHRWGPITLETLTTVKRIAQGDSIYH
ncbi:MAG: glutamate-5-semialdehyde dehydrogenase [Synechococcales bacterium]|nr:glutamate-5-semialdehyde dehydrogenase [Synechococcales bacterium]